MSDLKKVEKKRGRGRPPGKKNKLHAAARAAKKSKPKAVVAVNTTFYTSAEQEEWIEATYLERLEKKKNEIDARVKATGKIEKYTARAFVFKLKGDFVVDGKRIIFDGLPEAISECPLKYVEGGRRYTYDGNFREDFESFCSSHTKYRASFDSEGGGVRYSGPGMPCTLSSEADKDGVKEIFKAVNEDAYDLVYG